MVSLRRRGAPTDIWLSMCDVFLGKENLPLSYFVVFGKGKVAVVC